MRKLLTSIVIVAMAVVFSASFSVAEGEYPEVAPMYQFSDLGITATTTAEEIAQKAVALSELARSIQALNEQRLEELNLQAVTAKTEAAKAKDLLNQMKEQNKGLAAQAKVLELQLKIATIEAEKTEATAPAPTAAKQ